jgi:type IV secretion system protein VirD4
MTDDFPAPQTMSRLELWRAATTAFWVVGLGIVLYYAYRQYSAVALLFDVLFHLSRYRTTLGTFIGGLFSNSYDDINASVFYNLWLTLCGLFALGKSLPLLRNPDQWIEFRKFAWLLVCTTAVMGFPLMAWISSGLNHIPTSWWVLIIARLVLTALAMPFAGIATLLGLVLTVIVLTLAFTILFLKLPLFAFEYINNYEANEHITNQQKAGLANYLYRFNLWLRGEPLPYIPDDTKGARLAIGTEIESLHKPGPDSMGFGHIGNPLFLKTEKHVLIMASTRSGKGVTLIIPHLLRYQGSAFVLDPKGENAKATGRQRAALNDKVHYLDPFGISGKPRARLNPLSRFNPENMEAESKALASALFLVPENERDHWNAAAQQLVAAVILYVYVSKEFPRAKKDLPTVRRILLGGLKPALQAMVMIDDADGLLRDLAMSFLETPEKEFGSVVSHAQRQTEILDNPYIVACLSATGEGEEVDFKQWHKGTMTVYLCLSAPKFPTFNRWLRLVLTSALDEMTDTLDPPPLPVCFMLDELATLGHLASVENAIGLAAGYGIQLVCVWQDTAQMHDLYKGRWASFIGNSGVRALFNLDDYDTAEYWSKFIGGSLVESKSTQKDQWGLNSGNSNVSEAMRPFMPPDKIMMDFAAGKMLVLAQGAHPIITDRVAYFADASLDGLWDDPRIPIKPPAPKKPPPAPAPATTPAPKPSPVPTAKQPPAPQKPAEAKRPIDLFPLPPRDIPPPRE